MDGNARKVAGKDFVAEEFALNKLDGLKAAHQMLCGIAEAADAAEEV